METIKSLKSLQTCLGIFFLLFLGTFYVSAEEYGAASEKKREVSKTFQVSLSDNLSIENRYGNITVTHWNKNEIEIKVVIEAKARNDQRVEELLNYVDIILDKTGNMVRGATSMKSFSGTKNNERLTVNYYISKPSKVKPYFEQRYGNINLPLENDAQTTLNVKYGNINGGNFSEDLKVECSYGNIEVEDLNTASMELSYCGRVKIGNGKVLSMESRYSNGKIGNMGQLNLELSYGNFNIENIGTANIDSKYSNLDIRRLDKYIYTEFSYGTIDIQEVSSTLNEIKAEARYGNLNITIPTSLAFEVIAEDMKYANYNISDRFNAHTTKNQHNFNSKINNGHSTRKVYFMGNNYSNLTIKAQ